MSRDGDARAHGETGRAAAVEVPLVDLACFTAPRTADGEVARFDAAHRIHQALVRFGFVRVVGHGVCREDLDRVDALFAQFFAWPEERKRRVSGVAGGQRGYSPFGLEHARDRARPDPKAFFHVGQPHPGGPHAAAYPANVFPEALPELEAASLRLFAALERASHAVLEAIECAVGLAPGRLTGMIEGGNSILRALHYPALDAAAFEAERADDRTLRSASGEIAVLRAAPHEDINLVTLLPASSEPGLEILQRDPASGRSSWLDIRCQPGEIVADVGDMLARASGGALPATPHRVVATRATAGRHRRAFPFFAHPRPECDLSVEAGFLEGREAPAWPGITAGEFLAERLREIGLID